MNKLIVIIHASEVIRKGLAAILRSFFVTEILQLENLHAFYSYREMKNHSLILMVGDPGIHNDELLKVLQKNNQLKLIYLDSQNNNSILPPGFFESSINLNTTGFEIQEIVSNCWKTGEKTSRLPDNDELTTREKEVLRLVALGHSNKIIADKLFISIHTVISHRKNISEKTGIKSISGLTVYAILNNLIDTKTINPEDLI